MTKTRIDTGNLVGRLDPFDPLDPDSWAGSSKKTQAR